MSLKEKTLALLCDFQMKDAADEASISLFLSQLCSNPAAGYIDFIRASNGGEGFVGKRYLMMWPLEELKENNDGYPVKKAAPGLFLIGSSGGGLAYAFDLRSSTPRYVSIPDIGMDINEIEDMGGSFDEFVSLLFGPHPASAQ